MEAQIMSVQRTRPTSPHLQIYRLPLNAILSILHRASGVVTYVYLMLISWLVIAGNILEIPLDGPISLLRGKPGIFFLMPFIISVIYHMLNGVKYLGWTIGIGYELKTAEKTGYVVIIGTFICTALVTWKLLSAV